MFTSSGERNSNKRTSLHENVLERYFT